LDLNIEVKKFNNRKEVLNAMSKKVKPSAKELQKKIEDLRKLAKEYRNELEDRVKTKPLESAGIIFVAGLILGVLIGTSISGKR